MFDSDFRIKPRKKKKNNTKANFKVASTLYGLVLNDSDKRRPKKKKKKKKRV